MNSDSIRNVDINDVSSDSNAYYNQLTEKCYNWMNVNRQFPTTLLNANVTINQANQHFVYAGEYERGLLIDKIPIGKANDVINLLHELRRHVVFNELFSSCFNADTTTILPNAPPPLTSDMDTELLYQKFEVNCNYPYSITISFLHMDNKYQEINNFINMTVNIQCGGEIQVEIYEVPLWVDEKANKEQQASRLCTNEYATKLLATSHSIPLMLYYVLSKAKNKNV